MPIQPYDGSAVRQDPETVWHITAAMDTDAKPHPVVVTHCGRSLPIVGPVFEELTGKVGVCGACTAAYAGHAAKH
jgi:hypothetical protein